MLLKTYYIINLCFCFINESSTLEPVCATDSEHQIVKLYLLIMFSDSRYQNNIIKLHLPLQSLLQDCRRLSGTGLRILLYSSTKKLYTDRRSVLQKGGERFLEPRSQLWAVGFNTALCSWDVGHSVTEFPLMAGGVQVITSGQMFVVHSPDVQISALGTDVSPKLSSSKIGAFSPTLKSTIS